LDEEHLATLEFAYAPLLQFSQRGLRSVDRWITTNPEAFVELVRAVYKKRGDPSPVNFTEDQHYFATNAWTVLQQCKRAPGQALNGTAVDEDELRSWVETARKLCREADREQMGDQTIGQLLSHVGVGNDRVWPTEGVRRVLDLDDAEDIRKGFHIGVINNRGVSSRTYDEGGAQERQLAKKFQKCAEALADSYPRLAATIEMVQKYYEREARREDDEAKLRIEGS
jgi:hypothetical protein